jgi:hypothetical protein
MIKYQWELPSGGRLLLEKDPAPLKGFPKSYQLRYQTDEYNAGIDFNFDVNQPFETRFAYQTLCDLIADCDYVAVDIIINEANVLVELGRNA